MANRYEHASIIPNARKQESTNDNFRTVRRLSTVMYPDLSQAEDTQIVTQEGDRLDLLAKEFYGDETFWFAIARVNGLGKGSMAVPPGIIIRIPYYQEYSGISSLIQSYNQER
mgnify:CR=1 FL=1|jgi:nucleoid-associated protein YgaU